MNWYRRAQAKDPFAFQPVAPAKPKSKNRPSGLNPALEGLIPPVPGQEPRQKTDWEAKQVDPAVYKRWKLKQKKIDEMKKKVDEARQMPPQGVSQPQEEIVTEEDDLQEQSAADEMPPQGVSQPQDRFRRSTPPGISSLEQSEELKKAPGFTPPWQPQEQSKLEEGRPPEMQEWLKPRRDRLRTRR